jgi:hypothetical protein
MICISRPMREPPKMSDVQGKVVPVEVLPPEHARTAPTGTPPEGPPIHSLSALILVAVDSLWLPVDLLPPIILLAIPACFVAVFVPTFLIQKHLKGDSNGRALTFATVLAVLAAIPTPITGTPIGLALLAWTGLGKLFGRTPPKP